MIIVDAANWAGDGTNRGHEWPLLRNGDNDVYLMTLAHAALMESGFWCGEDDTEEMYFGKKTEEAVEFFQGANGPGLEVNGMINTKTWLALLGKEKFEWGPAPGAILDEDVASCREGIARKAFEDTQKKLKAVVAKEDEDPYGEDIDSGPPAEDDFIDVKGSSGDSVEWPILRLDEGGFTVHKMQAMLSTLGFNCGEDDSEYWFMGPDTQNALQTFQASESLPETGVVDFANLDQTLRRVRLYERNHEDGRGRVRHGSRKRVQRRQIARVWGKREPRRVVDWRAEVRELPDMKMKTTHRILIF